MPLKPRTSSPSPARCGAAASARVPSSPSWLARRSSVVSRDRCPHDASAAAPTGVIALLLRSSILSRLSAGVLTSSRTPSSPRRLFHRLRAVSRSRKGRSTRIAATAGPSPVWLRSSAGRGGRGGNHPGGGRLLPGVRVPPPQLDTLDPRLRLVPFRQRQQGLHVCFCRQKAAHEPPAPNALTQWTEPVGGVPVKQLAFAVF